MKALLKDYMRWFFFCPFKKANYLLPMKISYILCDLIGVASYLLMQEKQDLMKKELLNIFNGEIDRGDISIILKRAFSMIVKEKIEILLFPRLNRKKVNNLCSFDGLYRLDEALKEKRGAILLIAHFGNQRFILPALGFLGYKVNQLGAPPTVWKELEKDVSKMKAKNLERELECERSLPVNFIYYNKFMRSVFKCLENNEVLVIAGDSVGDGKKLEVDFLNRTAMLSPGPFNIAKKSGAPIFPIFIVRNKNNTHKIIIEERLNLSLSGNKKEEELYNLNQFVRLLELYVKKYPCHYLKHLWWVQSRRYLDPSPFFKIVDNGLNRSNQIFSELIP